MSGDGQGPDKGADKLFVDCDLDAPPAKVWRALTEPEFVAAWLTEGDIADTVEIEILAVEPGRQISYAWREAARESVVTFAVTETASGGSHLRLVHDAAPRRLTMALSRRRIARPNLPERLAGARVPTTMRWAA